MNYFLQLQGHKYFKTTLENTTNVEEILINNDIIKLSKDGKGSPTILHRCIIPLISPLTKKNRGGTITKTPQMMG